MKIGNLEFEHFAALAPMAGVADHTFRQLCINYGASFCVSELISSKGVSLGDKKSKSLMNIYNSARPSATQLFGSDPEIMAVAAKSAMQFDPDFIDINMGCPAPKVAASGGGCALMKNPQLAGEVVNKVANAVDVPVTVKIRLGWDADSINALEVAKICEQAGAKAVTLHPRTREQMYSGKADWQYIKLLKDNLSIPVIGSGDIITPKDAARMYEETGCDMVMVGRGAMGRPWIFEQINAYIKHSVILPDPPLSKRMTVLLEQAKDTCSIKGERVGMKEMRKHAAWYIKGIRGGAKYRNMCGSISTIEQLAHLCYLICKEAEDEI